MLNTLIRKLCKYSGDYKYLYKSNRKSRTKVVQFTSNQRKCFHYVAEAIYIEAKDVNVCFSSIYN